MGESFRVIQRGDADVMIVGGERSMGVTPFLRKLASPLCALSSTRNDDPVTASRPWDSGRDGPVVGEGAGVLILEEYEHAVKRGATILAELVGYAANSDAYHTNAPPEDGRGVRRVMQLALADAGVSPSDIKYLNAHATSTPLGDRAEARAICETFGDSAKSLLVSSTKSMTGHLLAQRGPESLRTVCIMALGTRWLRPRRICSDVDEALRL